MAPTKHFPPPPGVKAPPLSFAARTGDLLFISGIPGFDDKRRLPAEFEAQFANVVTNIKRVLDEAGGTFRDLVKVNVLLTRASDVATMNVLYASAFGPAPYPARTTCVVQALPDPEDADRDRGRGVAEIVGGKAKRTHRFANGKGWVTRREPVLRFLALLLEHRLEQFFARSSSSFVKTTDLTLPTGSWIMPLFVQAAEHIPVQHLSRPCGRRAVSDRAAPAQRRRSCLY